MGRVRTKPRDRSWGAIPTAVVSGAAAALTSTGATELLDTPAGVAGVVGGATAVICYLAAHRLVVAKARKRVRTADRLVLETQMQLRDEKSDRAARRELDRALDQAESEEAALVVMGHALARHFPDRPIEVHLVDPVEPVLVVEIAQARPSDALGQRSSPWEPLATRANSTLVYQSTEQVDACAHLRARAGSPSSAVAIPLTATGRILGVVYAFGPDGQAPGSSEVTLLEEFASAIAARLAVMRTPESPIQTDSIDQITGLPDRATMQDRVIKLVGEQIPFTVAIADVDDLKGLNRTRGRETGDAALALLGRVARRAIRPDDLVGRVGGDELLFVMPRTDPANAARALERIREELFVAQSVADEAPRFTISVGVVGAPAGLTIDAILKTAATALRSARDAGGNRIVIGEPVSEPT